MTIAQGELTRKQRGRLSSQNWSHCGSPINLRILIQFTIVFRASASHVERENIVIFMIVENVFILSTECDDVNRRAAPWWYSTKMIGSSSSVTDASIYKVGWDELKLGTGGSEHQTAVGCSECYRRPESCFCPETPELPIQLSSIGKRPRGYYRIWSQHPHQPEDVCPKVPSQLQSFQLHSRDF